MNTLTKKELIELCKKKDIGYSKKNKKELIELLNGNGKMSISRTDAEKSADEWMPIIREWMINAIMDPVQHRDIGKVLAQATEIVGVQMLDLMSGRTNKIIVGKSYDCITDDPGKIVRSQIKFRMGDWHFETTRRNSQKNADTNSTGHVAYRKDEFDMVAIFTPSSTFGISGSKLRCIPVGALINPEKPDQVVTRILSGVRKVYDTDSKTQEVINQLFH